MLLWPPLDATLLGLSSAGGEESLEDAPESEIAELWLLVRVPDEVSQGKVLGDWSFGRLVWDCAIGSELFSGARLDSTDSFTRGRV